MNNLNECCGAYPTVYMPMWWGNKQIDESLAPHVECGKCGRVCHGKTPDDAYDNWNSTNERTPKEAYKEFDKQTKRDIEEAEIRNCPVRGPILKKMDEAISKSRKELCDWLMSDKKPSISDITGSDEALKLAQRVLEMRQVKYEQKETKMIDFSTAKGGDAAKAFRELGKVIDNLNKQKETTMIDLSTAKIGDEFVLRNGKVVSFFARTKMNSICQSITGHAMLYEHSGKFDESVEPGDKPKNWDIIAKHDSRTDEEKAIDDLIKPALIFAASSGSYQKDAEKFLNVIKADEIHGVKWVVE